MPGNTKLSQTCLLSLVQQFTVSLNRDRDLKFKWIELVIPEIDMTNQEIAIIVAPVAQQLVCALQGRRKLSEHIQHTNYYRDDREFSRRASTSLHPSSLPDDAFLVAPGSHAFTEEL